MAIRKYSLWFMPAGATKQKFSQLIARLAEDYASPKFPPHITLLGSIEAGEEEMISHAQALASLIHPFLAKLIDITYTDYYYRALFARVEPSAELLAAYRRVLEIFPDIQKADYMPHLSLLYGDFFLETKKEMIEKIGASFLDEFEVDTLHLYLTEGAVSTWESKGTFPLQR